MHTLFLMRHAQPASHAPGGDRERPLTDVGRRQAREVGTRLGLRNVGHALVSDALRTRQTWDCLQLDCPVEFMRALYYCGTDTCLLYTSPSPRDRTRSRMPSSA